MATLKTAGALLLSLRRNTGLESIKAADLRGRFTLRRGAV
jgi:hypothetical protein